MSFLHDRGDEHVSHHLERGASLALRSDDAGRSPIADALFGLRDWDKGSLLLDGDDVRDLALDGLRTRVSVVRQPETMPGTIAENMSVGHRPPRASEIWAALRSVGLEERVRALNDGLATKLTPSGLPLSPRESLRLTLARALLARPALLVVDGSLDAFPENEQPELMRVMARDRTLICVTRTEGLASLCDARLEEEALT